MKYIISVIIAGVFLVSANAQVPGTLSYQGILVKSDGTPVTDGNHTVQFNFYKVVSGGLPIFARGPMTVTTYKGMFTLLLGTGTPASVNDPLPVLDSDPNYIGGEQYYLELVADNVILSPRVQLSSVPYAFNAQNANRMDAAGLTGSANLPNAILDTDLQDLADGTLTGSKVGTGIDASNITTNNLAIANGGTGANTSADARTNLGLVIGTDVQAFDADLTDLADGSLTGSKVGAGISGANITTGTVSSAQITDLTIVNSDIAAAAAVAVSKLEAGADGTVLTTVTGVPTWQAPVTGVTTLDGLNDATILTPAAGQILVHDGAGQFKNVAASGDATISSSGAITLTSNSVASAEIADLSIVNDDINAAAGIVDTKLATISTAGKVANSATTATSSNTANTIVARNTSGNFSAGTITATLIGNASTVTTNANLTGDVTSVGNATSIAAGVIVNSDINASAAIADTKLATISTAGKVSGNAITSGIIGGSTRINTTVGPNTGISVNTTTGTSSDYIAIEGTSITNPGYGMGGFFTGGYRGIYSQATPTSYTGASYGVYATNFGGTAGSHYGVYATASGTGTNYAVYGFASGGTTNWAGYFPGQVYINGTTYGSDRKLKKNINALGNGLELIMKLKPSTYQFRDDGEFKRMNLPSNQHFGLIAQDVEEVIPSLVSEVVHPADIDPKTRVEKSSEIKFKGVNYNELIPILIKAIQQQQSQIESMKAEIEILKRK